MAKNEEAAILAAAVAELQRLGAAALQRRWRSLVGGSVPAGLGRPLTLRVLAYKLQAQHLGDLDRASLRELSALFNGAKTANDQGREGSAEVSRMPADVGASAKASAPASRSLTKDASRTARPGTLLVREHGGVLHRVMVLDEGVTWNGRTYDSLSQVALAITGTRWNGPRFFGLRDKQQTASKPQGWVDGGAKAEQKLVIGRGRVPRLSRSSSQRGAP